jgi:hypothetical protein
VIELSSFSIAVCTLEVRRGPSLGQCGLAPMVGGSLLSPVGGMELEVDDDATTDLVGLASGGLGWGQSGLGEAAVDEFGMALDVGEASAEGAGEVVGIGECSVRHRPSP